MKFGDFRRNFGQDGSFSVASAGGGGGGGGHRRHMQDDAGARCEPNECTTGLTIANSNRNDDARCSVSPIPPFLRKIV